MDVLILKLFKFWENKDCNAPYLVFNELLLVEYKDLVTLSGLQDFMIQYPGVKVNGHGIDELLYSNRFDIIEYMMNIDAVTPSGKNVLEIRSMQYTAEYNTEP
jgi:hypothetical protein